MTRQFELSATFPNFVTVNNAWVGSAECENFQNDSESRLILPHSNQPCKCTDEILKLYGNNRIMGNGSSVPLGNAAQIKIGCIQFIFATAFNFG